MIVSDNLELFKNNINNNLIIFYGASVTEQKNGYVHEFDILIKNIIPEDDYIIAKWGFGSMHLSDAGICFLNKIINEKPKYVFLDWFSTGMIYEKSQLIDYLDLLMYSFGVNNITPILLLLDRNPIEDRRLLMYIDIEFYVKKNNIFCIKLYNNNINNILRDEIHTTNKGAKLYGIKIFNYFINNIYKNHINYRFKNKSELKLVDYLNINLLHLEIEVKKIIKFSGSGKILGLYNKIGPYSGIIYVESDNEPEYPILIWDRWCHFERLTIKLAVDFKQSINIRISDDEFDKSECKDKTYNWNSLDNYKRLYIHDIFYIGTLNLDYYE